MKLDDRPVIEQLLNPTPLQILDDVEEELTEWLLDNEDKMHDEEYAGSHAMLKRVVAALDESLDRGDG